jgi:glutamate-1-semialdehyde 2,1-aminomutase
MNFRERANRIIPGGAHTYSKGHDQFPANAPQAFVRGKGARVWDVDGREFVDWGMGVNNVLIGHAEDAIDDAACAALRNGQNFSRPTLVEVEAAEELVDLLDGMEMAKFAKNGSDANTAALRLARAITGRPVIFFDGAAPFLAIHDWFIGNTAMNAGVPDAISRLARPFTFNDTSSVDRLFEAHGRECAAVILEPCRDQRPADGFLQRIREQCNRHGALLIFDEVVTGFRLSMHGASRLFGVTPDLMSVGKALANGYALTALVGRRELMMRGGLDHADPRVFLLSTTNGAEQSALAAARATLTFYKQQDVIAQLASVGDCVRRALESATRPLGIGEFLSIRGDFAARSVLSCLDHEGAPSAAHRTLFQQELVRHGVFMPWVCPSFRHGPAEIEQTAVAFTHAAAVYARALEARSVDGLLDGPAVKPVFRRYN